jgi:outer membrane protein, heavy metal efflux system
MRCAVFLLLLLLPGAAVWAVEPGAEPPLTEVEYLTAALESPALRSVLELDREVAAAELGRRRLVERPVLELEHEEIDDSRESAVLLRWTPPLGRQRALAIEAAAARSTAAQARLEARRLELRLELRAAFAAWSLAEQRRQLLEGQRSQLLRLAERTEAQVRTGELPGLAGRRLRLEASELELELARAEAEVAAARASAQGLSPQALDHRRPALPERPERFATTGSVPTPELRALASEVAAATAQARASELRFAVPELGLGWKRFDDGAASASGPVLRLGWSLPWPDGRGTLRQEAAARLEAARGASTLAEGRAERRLAGAIDAFEALHGALERAPTSEHEPLLLASIAAYQAGEASLTDLLDTLRAVLAFRLAALETEAAALAAHRDLEAAAGRALPGDQP